MTWKFDCTFHPHDFRLKIELMKWEFFPETLLSSLGEKSDYFLTKSFCAIFFKDLKLFLTSRENFSSWSDVRQVHSWNYLHLKQFSTWNSHSIFKKSFGFCISALIAISNKTYIYFAKRQSFAKFSKQRQCFKFSFDDNQIIFNREITILISNNIYFTHRKQLIGAHCSWNKKKEKIRNFVNL